jgi:hypothetical protein
MVSTKGIGWFILACIALAFVAGACIGYAVPLFEQPPFGCCIAQPANESSDEYENALIHPETTPTVKWVKMTKATRDALMDVYAANADECNTFMYANERVTVGEAAILWLMKHEKE